MVQFLRRHKATLAVFLAVLLFTALNLSGARADGSGADSSILDAVTPGTAAVAALLTAAAGLVATVLAIKVIPIGMRFVLKYLRRTPA